MRVVVLVFAVFFSAVALAHTKEEWKDRAIYFALTDRFASSGNNATANCDLGNYCGGNFKGMISQLDYIKGMGFDAIWITPVVENTEGGYHGYWAKNIYAINEHFGTEEELKELVKAAHSKGIWIMLDVVGNHMGPVGYDYHTLEPFNSGEHYHDCNNCPGSCSIDDWQNQPQVEHCRLAGLPDLNHENQFVREKLLSWITEMQQKYDIDGFRVDTVPEVPKDFWREFQQAAGVFAIGEAFNGNPDYVAGYQGQALDSMLSYPMYYTLLDVFAFHKSMKGLESRLKEYKEKFPDASVLGTFLDNHDNARFLHKNGDHTAFKAALTWTILAEGIPIVYYGSEQGFAGGDDPQNREVLWEHGFDTTSDLYAHLATLNKQRVAGKIGQEPQIQRFAGENFYAFSRGETFVALTNGGNGANSITETITYHPYKEGQTACNIFNTDDCITVSGGQFAVTLSNGESKVFAPNVGLAQWISEVLE